MGGSSMLGARNYHDSIKCTKFLSRYIHHGTTVGTNAILEGKGAKAGLVVTAGTQIILLECCTR